MLIIPVTFCALGCKGLAKQGDDDPNIKVIEQLRKNVMDVHDEVMPLTADIERYVSRWEKNPGNIPDSILAETIRDLKAADQAMWDWMYAFKAPADSVSFEGKKTYYRSEQERIDKVAVMMIDAVEKAKELKSKYE